MAKKIRGLHAPVCRPPSHSPIGTGVVTEQTGWLRPMPQLPYKNPTIDKKSFLQIPGLGFFWEIVFLIQ